MESSQKAFESMQSRTAAVYRLARPLVARAALFVGLMFIAGCGNSFRPVANPILQPGGTPSGFGNAIVIGANGGSPGTATNINIGGDTNAGLHQIGVSPVHAGFGAANLRVFVANPGDNTVTSYFTLGGVGTTITTINMPPGSSPVFVHTNEATSMYVALSGADPACGGGRGDVGFISQGLLTLTGTTCVGVNPVALAETADGLKVFVVNQGDNTVSVMATVDHSIPNTIGVGSAPVAAALSADNYLYVANSGSGTVTVINAVSEAVVGAVPVGTNPTAVKYDSTNKLILVANTGSNNVTTINADSTSSTFLSTGIIPVGAAPGAITVLANGSRAYVANRGDNTVSVISPSTSAVTKIIPVGAAPVSIASSGDSSKVYTANSGSANVSIIRTSDDTVVSTMSTLPATPKYVVVSTSTNN